MNFGVVQVAQATRGEAGPVLNSPRSSLTDRGHGMGSPEQAHGLTHTVHPSPGVAHIIWGGVREKWESNGVVTAFFTAKKTTIG